MTTLFHVRLHLPWTWRLGARDESERGQFLDMLPELPADCLIAGDAGFVGYELAAGVIGSGRELLVRVGSNIRLLKKLGFVRESGDTVYVWPDKAARKNLPPLIFRLVVMQGPKHPIYLLTSVTNRRLLSDQQVIEIYKARWSIEVYHRHLKQTFGRRKLLSRRADNARIELEWSLIGLWAMALYATGELADYKIPLERMSMAGVLKSFRTMARDYLHPANSRRTLRILIRTSILDTYTRKQKTSRGYPRKKKPKAAGKPTIIIATTQQRQKAKQLQLSHP